MTLTLHGLFPCMQCAMWRYWLYFAWNITDAKSFVGYSWYKIFGGAGSWWLPTTRASAFVFMLPWCSGITKAEHFTGWSIIKIYRTFSHQSSGGVAGGKVSWGRFIIDIYSLKWLHSPDEGYLKYLRFSIYIYFFSSLHF